MEKNEIKKTSVVLNPDSAFEIDIARELKKLITSTDLFYHIEVNNNLLMVCKQGYNTPTFELVEYDMSQLKENKVLNQKENAIREAYLYTFVKTNSLNRSANQHAFYHDRTGKYPEEKILDSLQRKIEEIQNKVHK